MIGDDLNRDVAGAQKSGIFGVWVDWRQNGLPPSASVKPDHIVYRISELLDKGFF
jgi:putative hydrolase of the HAD superfamily